MSSLTKKQNEIWQKTVRVLNDTPGTVLIAVLFTLLFAISVFGIKNGIGSPDESFYLTIPYRITLGNALYRDEWHASQNSAFLQYLPMWLYIEITGSTNGVLLFFRFLYVCCQTSVSLFIYKLMCRYYGKWTGFATAFIFMTYTPETVPTLDYYTMSFMGYAVIAFLLAFSKKPKACVLIFVGVVLACTVTAMPFNSLVYFAYTVVILIFAVKKKTRPFMLSLRAWLFITVGVVLTAGVFLVWLLKNQTLEELLKNFSMIFSGNDHILPFTKGQQSDMFTWWVIIKTIFEALPVFTVLSFAVLSVVVFDKNRLKHSRVYVICSATLNAVFAVNCLFTSAALFYPLPLFIFAVTLYLVTKDKDKRLLFILCTGVIYVFLLGLVSQAFDYVGAYGFVLSSSVMVALFVNWKKQTKIYTERGKHPQKSVKVYRKSAVASTVAIGLCLSVCAGFFGYNYLSDDSMATAFSRQRTPRITITSGPLKGIRASQTEYTVYEAMLSDMEKINNGEYRNVLICNLCPWCYLALSATPATDTTWYITEEADLLFTYYENEMHLPDCVYVPYYDFYWCGAVNSLSEPEVETVQIILDKLPVIKSEKGAGGTLYYIAT